MTDGHVGRGPGPGAGHSGGAGSLLLTEVGGDQGHPEAPGGATEALAVRDRLIVESISQNGGTMLGVPAIADCLCATFAEPAQAVAAACTIQREIRTQPRLSDLAPRVVVHAGSDHRDQWRVASVCDQVRTFARAGQILVGGTITALPLGALPPGTRLLPFASHLPGPLAELGPIFEIALGRSEVEITGYTRDLAARATAISNDLSALLSNLVYRLLARPGATSGLTLAQASASFGVVEALRPGFSTVESLLADAVAALGGGMRLSPDELGQLERLLYWPSIELPDRSRTPAEVLTEMAEAVHAATGVVTRAGDAWKRTVPQLARCQEDLEALHEKATALRAAGPARQLTDVIAKVRSLAALAPSDPLQAAESFEGGVLQRVERGRASVEAEVRQQQVVAAEVERALARLAELRAVHRQAVNGIRQLRRAIARVGGIPAPLDGAYLDAPPMGLGPWIARLDQLCRAGSHRQVRKGLERWWQVADQALAGEREVLNALRVPFQRRKELRSLLVALEAKAAAMGLAGDAQLAELGRLARTGLFTSPTDLDEAGQRVLQYQDHVRNRTMPIQRKVKQG